MVNKKKFIYFGSLVFLAVFLLFSYFVLRKQANKIHKYEVQFAYSVTSIDPTIYDDWESGFIGNHIYSRLLPEENKPSIPYLTKALSIVCEEPASSSLNENCKKVRITFKPNSFSDCYGRRYVTKDIMKEFEAVLTKRRWLIPFWKKCDSGNDANTICVTGKYVPDQFRRMRSVDLRFGWSKAKKEDGIYGVGPYCLYANFNLAGHIDSGNLKPRSITSNLPVISFHTSQRKEDQFQLALYGNKDLLTKNRKNIQVHTPLSYYVVTHPRLDKYQLPWNTIETKKIIHDYLTENEIFFADIPQFIKFSPEGKALLTTNKKKFPTHLEFAIPNYLPGCQKLAKLLNKKWIGKQANAFCTDIVAYVYKNVVENKIGWDGFIVGISSSDPSRDSLRYQYFSPDSSNSWTYTHLNPDKLFYRVGIGQSLATVDGTMICDIRPNSLGLSDIFITDLLTCNR